MSPPPYPGNCVTPFLNGVGVSPRFLECMSLPSGFVCLVIDGWNPLRNALTVDWLNISPNIDSVIGFLELLIF